MKFTKFLSGAFLMGILSIGIFGQSGHITGVVADPSDPSGNTYYVGSANGGVWKTTNGGTSWVVVIALNAAPLLATL